MSVDLVARIEQVFPDQPLPDMTLRQAQLDDQSMDREIWVSLRVRDVCNGKLVVPRAIVMQQKTQRPVQFEITGPTRDAISAWISAAKLFPESPLFPSRVRRSPHMSTRQYARIVASWVKQLGLDRASYGTHTLRRTKATLIYRRTKNLRAVQLLKCNHSSVMDCGQQGYGVSRTVRLPSLACLVLLSSLRMNFATCVSLLKQRIDPPLRLIDVGARWGIGSRWNELVDVASILCFDPDSEECARLNESSPANVRYLPYGLAEHNGDLVLHVTRGAACSSIYPPRHALYDNYPCLEFMRPAAKTTIHCRRLDDVIEEERFGVVDAIKVDTQGSELPILRGGTTALRGSLFVDIEVEFNALYEGQPLFHQVDAFMREQDFVLWRFDNLVHYSPTRDERARTPMVIGGDPDDAVTVLAPGGQLFWAQALYVRSDLVPSQHTSLQADRAHRAALLALIYGAWDLASLIAERGADMEIVRAFG